MGFGPIVVLANDDFQRQIGQLPIKLRRQLATTIAQDADKLASAIKAAAPIRTGAMRDNVRARAVLSSP
ncbi:hypothetical protein AB7M63_002876 [Bradyrhizobium japonicum]